MPPASLQPRYVRSASVAPMASSRFVRSTSVAPISPSIYYREVSVPADRRVYVNSRESSVYSEPQVTVRAQSVPRVVSALPTPKAILMSRGYQPYLRFYQRPAHRSVTSSRTTSGARYVVHPTRPVIRPVSGKRKVARKIRAPTRPAREVLANPLPPIPHLKQWSLSQRVLARPWTTSTRMFPLEDRCHSLDLSGVF